MKNKHLMLSILSAASLVVSTASRADEVTDWNQNMLKAIADGGVLGLPVIRLAAIVEGAVFDAVNGIERRYTPVHVPPDAPPGASKRAAAIQAAYATLVVLIPGQKVTLDMELANSLSALHGGKNSIANGRAWGQYVAEQIIAWRATDGFTPNPPPYTGSTAVGNWRPTPPGNLPGAFPQFATMTPWVLSAPFQFRPPGPPALGSLQYVQEYVETKLMGRIDSAERTPDETLYSSFWATASSGALYYWNTLAQRLSQDRHFGLLKNAQLFAHLNLGMADSAIACWEAKYHYNFWRPITAINLGDTDGNEDTVGSPSWLPLLITPNFPEYPSGHSTISGGGIAVLASYFGVNTPFWLDNDRMPGVVRNYANFDQARDEVANARIFAGIHFRTACVDGFATGAIVGNYVLQHSLQPCGNNSKEENNDD